MTDDQALPKIEVFARAFYSPALHLEQPSSTFAFSELRQRRNKRGFYGVSRTANILWQASDINEAIRSIEGLYPDATIRGAFTSDNKLLTIDRLALAVVGPRIILDNFEDGPIKRLPEPNQSHARHGIFKVVANNKPKASNKL